MKLKKFTVTLKEEVFITYSVDAKNLGDAEEKILTNNLSNCILTNEQRCYREIESSEEIK